MERVAPVVDQTIAALARQGVTRDKFVRIF